PHVGNRGLGTVGIYFKMIDFRGFVSSIDYLLFMTAPHLPRFSRRSRFYHSPQRRALMQNLGKRTACSIRNLGGIERKQTGNRVGIYRLRRRSTLVGQILLYQTPQSVVLIRGNQIQTTTRTSMRNMLNDPS